MKLVKYSCYFCGKSNTKMTPQYVSSGFLGLGHTQIGNIEEIDPDSDPFYRCVYCGSVICQEHYVSLCRKKETGWLKTKTWYECPQCGSTNLKKL